MPRKLLALVIALALVLQCSAAVVAEDVTPVFVDHLDGSSTGNDNARVAFVSGHQGLAAQFTSDDSYIRYSGSILSSDQGAIEFYWKPPADIYGLYSYRHQGWTNYSKNAPPSNGFLLDNVGWKPASKGSFCVLLQPVVSLTAESTGSTLVMNMWNGSTWYRASATRSSCPTIISAEVSGSKATLSWNSTYPIWLWDPNTWYMITVTWGPNGNILYVNGREWARSGHTGQICTSGSFSLGQDPTNQTHANAYWPYGPHSMLGTYDELKVYDRQIVPSAADPDVSSPSGYTVSYGTSSKSYTNSVDFGDVTSCELSLQAGTYYLVITPRTTTGFVGLKSGEVTVTIASHPAVSLVADLELPESIWVKGPYVYILENAGRDSVYRGKICLDRYDVIAGENIVVVNNSRNSRTVAVASDGKIYLAAYVGYIPGENGSVSVVDPETNTETPLLDIEIAATDIFIDSNGDILVIGSSYEADAKSIYLLPAGDYTHPRVLKEGLGVAWCVSKMGNYVYFSDQVAIKRFDISGGATETFLNKPVMSITFSSEYLYYADYFQGTIGRVGLTTRTDETILSGLNHVMCVRYDDSSGWLYFIEGGTNANHYKDGALKVLQLVSAHKVEVTSQYGITSGQGYYQSGKTATVTVSPTTIQKDIFSNCIFEGWKAGGITVSSSATYSFTVAQSVSLTASWKTELNLVIVGGLAAGILVVVVVVAVLVLRRPKAAITTAPPSPPTMPPT